MVAFENKLSFLNSKFIERNPPEEAPARQEPFHDRGKNNLPVEFNIHSNPVLG